MSEGAPIDAALAEKALAEGLRVYPRFAAMKPFIEQVKLFRGTTLQVKFREDARVPGDPENFAFEKVVLKTYRALVES